MLSLALTSCALPSWVLPSGVFPSRIVACLTNATANELCATVSAVLTAPDKTTVGVDLTVEANVAAVRWPVAEAALAEAVAVGVLGAAAPSLAILWAGLGVLDPTFIGVRICLIRFITAAFVGKNHLFDVLNLWYAKLFVR